MTPEDPPWLAPLEADATDVIACWRIFDWDLADLKRLRRELRARVADNDAPRILAQQSGCCSSAFTT